MTLLVASVLMAGIAGFLVIHPILARRAALVRDVTTGAVLDAEARRRVTLAELKELEYDFLGGKIDEADYRVLRERISREALEAIRAADALRGTAAGGEDAAADRPADAGAVHACGYPNAAHSRFCGGCGERLD